MSARLDNGESGNEEEGATCLQPTESNRIKRARDWVVGDSKLSDRARFAVWLLFVFCLLLFVTVVILAVCWPITASEGCTTPDCVRVAAEQMQYMDDSADQCTSPRQWSCGGWLEENAQEVPARPSWSVQDSIKILELRRLRDILTTMSSALRTETIEWRVKTLYDSCMATDVHIIEEDSYRFLDKIIMELDGWHVRNDWSPYNWNWLRSLEVLQSQYGISPLFSVGLTWHDNTTAFHLKPDGFGMPDPTFYALSPESEMVKAYKILLKDVALGLGSTSHAASRFADDIFSFEKRLADLIMGEYEMNTETWMNVADLNTNSVQLPFQNVLSAMFPKVPIANDTMVLVTAPHYMTYLISITTGTSASILNDYFIWTVIKAYLPYMSSNFRLMWHEYQSHLTGSTKEPERWEFCARLVQRAAPLAAQAILENENNDSDEDLKEHVREMFEAIKAKVVQDIVASKHMAEQQKNLLTEQVTSLNLQIGLRSVEKSPEYLEFYYKGRFYVRKLDLFQNIRFTLESKQDIIQKSMMDVDFSIITETVRMLTLTEASYNRQTNTVVLPTALVSKPYYSVEYPRSVQLARLGVTLATAIAKAIYPAKKSTTYCLLRKMPDVVQTPQAMNVAATAYYRGLGVKLAFEVSKDVTEYNNALPVIRQYYGDKLFVLSYAQTLCSMITPQQILLEAFKFNIDGETMFKAVWPEMTQIQQSLGCSQKDKCTEAV